VHVGTLMQRMGIAALAPQPGTSKRAPGHKIYPYLLRKLAITRANQVWALDTTYIPMARGFVYLTAVVDVFSRRVLAHRVAITLTRGPWGTVRPLRAPSAARMLPLDFLLVDPMEHPCMIVGTSCDWTGQAHAFTRPSISSTVASTASRGGTSRKIIPAIAT